MPARPWESRLRDIIDAIQKVERYTRGMSPETFAADERTIDAVVRNLIVLGEASRRVPTAVEAQHPEVPREKMRGIRNVVVHEYFGVDAEILWRTARDDLPSLLPLLERMAHESI